jgi:hypothetical protein
VSTLLDDGHRSTAHADVQSLTLLCSSLLAAFACRVQFLLAVALDRRERHIRVGRRLHLRQECRVGHSPRCAIGIANGGGNVTTDLCAAECAWSAAAHSLLQRLRRAIPSAMPRGEQCRSAGYTMASSERLEAVTPLAWSVLEEDVMLGIGAEMRHGCVVEEQSEDGH